MGISHGRWFYIKPRTGLTRHAQAMLGRRRGILEVVQGTNAEAVQDQRPIVVVVTNIRVVGK